MRLMWPVLQGVFILLTVIMLSACVTTWTNINSNNNVHQIGELKLQAPIGWNRFNQHENKYTALVKGHKRSVAVEREIFTKQGLPMHGIDILQYDRRLAFPSIDKEAHKDLLTLELSKLYLAELKVKHSIDRLQVVEDQPVEIDGYPGFRLHVRILNRNGLFYDNLTYGLLIDDSFYTLSYYGPKLHYFKTYLRDFKQLLASIKIVS